MNERIWLFRQFLHDYVLPVLTGGKVFRQKFDAFLVRATAIADEQYIFPCDKHVSAFGVSPFR